MPTEIAKTLATLYPDVEEAGGLSQALQKHLMKLPGGLIVTSDDRVQELFAYARVKQGHRFSQVMVAAQHRAFSVDLWDQGVCYGEGWVSSLEEVAQVVVAFLVNHATASRMRDTFRLIKVSEQAFVHETGPTVFVEDAWQGILRWLKSEKPGSPMARLLPLFEACMSRRRLRQLMPFTSHDTLAFSRTTGFPYTADCPAACPVAEDVFRMGGSGSVPAVIEGDAAMIADALEQHLPANCGPAVHGTAEDLDT